MALDLGHYFNDPCVNKLNSLAFCRFITSLAKPLSPKKLLLAFSGLTGKGYIAIKRNVTPSTSDSLPYSSSQFQNSSHQYYFKFSALHQLGVPLYLFPKNVIIFYFFFVRRNHIEPLPFPPVTFVYPLLCINLLHSKDIVFLT